MRGKRKKRRQKPPGQPKRDQGMFHPAFRDLAVLRDRARSTSKTTSDKEPSQQETAVDETREFLKAMADVEPFPENKERFIHEPNVRLRPAHPAPDEDLEAMTQLYDLIAGTAEMDITFSDEYIEGAVKGFSRKLMQRLKKGQFSVQDHLDLHGLTKPEAEMRLRDFLLENYRLGRRCVLVVHGRGLNSENHIPVLKERLPAWLMRGSARKIVLAFSTARPYDGGTGAIYILLRRKKAKATFDVQKGNF